MLERRHRLTSSAGFAETIRRGRRAGSRTLVVHLVADDTADTAGTDEPRVGVVVSRAVGGAVVRNRVKRRLRHLARARLARLPRSTMVVLRALPSAADASSARLAADLDAALTRLVARSHVPGSGTR
jgi:ribonuclease P protein component